MLHTLLLSLPTTAYPLQVPDEILQVIMSNLPGLVCMRSRLVCRRMSSVPAELLAQRLGQILSRLLWRRVLKGQKSNSIYLMEGNRIIAYFEHSSSWQARMRKESKYRSPRSGRMIKLNGLRVASIVQCFMEALTTSADIHVLLSLSGKAHPIVYRPPSWGFS